MLKLILKITAAIIAIALTIILFIKMLPWAIAVLVVAAVAKMIHRWWISSDIALTHFCCWPWCTRRKDTGGRPTTA